MFIVEVYAPERAKAFEGLFTQGSGRLHIRGSLEEHPSASKQNAEFHRRATNVTSESFAPGPRWGAYIPGLFAPHPTLNHQMVNLPFFLGLDLEAGGERIDAASPRVRSHRRELSLASGLLTREMQFTGPGGEHITARFERFVSAEHPMLCAQRLSLRSDRAATIRVRSTIDANVRTNGHDHFSATRLELPGDGLAACEVRTDGADTIRIETWTGGAWTDVEARREDRRVHLTGRIALKAGEEKMLEKRTLVIGGEGSAATSAAQADSLAALRRIPWEGLLAGHAAIWRERWQRSGVEIEGDARSNLAMRAAVYHLLRAHPGHDLAAIDAKGYAGEAYWGRFFWDSEMFLLPFYLYTDPARARQLLDFRVRTLDGAIANAARYGYRGAKYAWESDARGNECCPGWQYADHEVHITAGVAFGMAHYAAAADAEYLRGPAARAIVEGARFWMDRMDTREGDPHASLLGVMGPDEYAPISHNNAYTNWMAAFHLRLASQVGSWGGATPAQCAEFGWSSGRLGLVRSGDLILQCEGFDRLADPRFDRLWKDRSRTFAANVPQERLYRSRCLKQADVLMMMMLFPDAFTPEEVRRAWEYYVPLTTHDSSLSPCVHTIVACRLGLEDEAWGFWERVVGIDFEGAGASEGIHIANAGGMWQGAVMGFAGLRSALHEDDAVLEPRLPRAWESVEFPLAWRGGRLRARVERRRAIITNEGERPVRAGVRASRRSLAPGESIEVEP